MKSAMFRSVVLVVTLGFLGGCGKQGAFDRADLSSLEQGFESRQTIGDVSVSVKQLTAKDREYVFGRKNLTFSPVLVTIYNKGNDDLFFDTREQIFGLVKTEVSGGKWFLADSMLVTGPVVGSVVGAGVGLGALLYLAVNNDVLCIATVCSAGAIPMIFLGLGGLIGGVVGSIFGRKYAGSLCERERCKVQRANFLSKPSYVIKKNGKESILLFFEKNNVPSILPLTIKVQTEPAKTLAFELSTNCASQSNDFLYKTA